MSDLKIDVADPPWRDVKAWAEDKIEMYTRSLKTIGLSPEETEGARYAIAVLEALLKFPNPSKMSANVSEASD